MTFSVALAYRGRHALLWLPRPAAGPVSSILDSSGGSLYLQKTLARLQLRIAKRLRASRRVVEPLLLDRVGDSIDDVPRTRQALEKNLDARNRDGVRRVARVDDDRKAGGLGHRDRRRTVGAPVGQDRRDVEQL